MLRHPRPSPVLLALVAALACDGGLEPVSPCRSGFTGVCGTVRFRGAIPDSTDVVWVVAFEHFPQSTAELFTFQPPNPFELSLADTVASYELALPNGRYEWILGVWKKLGTLTLSNADTLLREAGFYRDPADPGRPGVVIVSGGATGSVDFVVDFDNMHPVSFWFPSPAGR